jgi:hypothetical protein
MGNLFCVGGEDAFVGYLFFGAGVRANVNFHIFYQLWAGAAPQPNLFSPGDSPSPALQGSLKVLDRKRAVLGERVPERGPIIANQPN